jgi:hypothetical protein
MKPNDHSLERLFKSAARASRPLPSEAPFAVEARVLAHWRRQSPDADELFSLLPLFRRGLTLACLIAVASMAFSYAGGQPASEEVAILNSVPEINYLP